MLPTDVQKFVIYEDWYVTERGIGVNSIEATITPKTKVIMLAHILGNSFSLGAVKALCETYDLWSIDDGCDALGAKYDGKMVGTWGKIGFTLPIIIRWERWYCI